MLAIAVERTHNRLLDALPCEELERLRGKLRPVHLSQGRTIYEAGELANYVYFPSSGLVALLSATAEGETVEVGMVGSEGTTGVPLIMHARNTPLRAVVQVPMLALCAEARVIQKEVQQGGRLAEILICYAHTVFAQLAQSAVCNRFHTAEQRLCRWLLSARDRVTDDTLALTQESLAATLGTQRSMVSTALTELQKNQLIRYSRGSITILDRMGLTASACECYEALKDQTCHCIDS
jgi:CRP-like cAMP-binding protein